LNNYEQVRQKRKEWREKNADYLREYRKKNNDHGVTLFRIWFKEHGDKEKRRDYMRAYMQWYRQIRRARKSDLPCNFSEADWRNTTTYFDGCCAVCGRPPGLWHTIAMDHWVPLSAPDCPGTIPANMIPLCHGIDGCNNSKHNKTPHKWLVSKFGKRKAAAILRRIEGYFASLTA
jgi:hypothetical protein